MIYIFIIALITLTIDQISKIVVMTTMTLGETKTIIKDFFQIYYITNDGIAFSFKFSQYKWLNIALQLLIAFLALAFFIYLSIKKFNTKRITITTFAIGLMLGGCVGNIFDRLFYPTHEVTDFLSFIIYYPWITEGKLIFKSTPFAIFNIADAALNVGVFLFLIYLLFLDPETHHKKNEQKEEFDDEVLVISKEESDE